MLLGLLSAAWASGCSPVASFQPEVVPTDGGEVSVKGWDDVKKDEFNVSLRLKPGRFSRTLRGAAPYETVFRIDGRPFRAFSAYVGFPPVSAGVVGLSGGPAPGDTRINFEVYVDGRLRAQSGFIGPEDGFRLVVADGLAGASELRLVARPAALPGECTHVHWLDATFHR